MTRQIECLVMFYLEIEMAKTMQSLIHEAESKWQLWLEVAEDPQALEDRNKTKEEAVVLANFFEGRFDGLCDARDLNA